MFVKPTEMPAPGETVIGRVMGMMENPPKLKMKIVRVEDKGLGFWYIDIKAHITTKNRV